MKRQKILVDDRIGSKHLIPKLRALGLPVASKRLDAGDVSFLGNASDGLASIGVELKNVDDLVASTVSKRLAGHQLPAMAREYDHRYLVIEGLFRSDDRGMVEVYRYFKWKPAFSRVSWVQLDKLLCTWEQMAGIRIRKTVDTDETAACIANLYSWWQKPWKAHKGHLALHDTPDSSILMPIDTRRRRSILAELPHIGWEKSGVVLRHFGTVGEAIMSTREEWMKVPGIGEKIADDILAALHG